ncbi:hypothetical protein [Actinacidiphila glaucinigra]|uniref:Uncharacterized protein n=1 Tax=Actinacidiphila glaucinigra TaxID=235986 RepID=A0A239NGL0_9ACTN|nr:hypothetical protein [Actinacidiphila glaucinigra]SNT54005.1 hypothetical protein SAMN05216252_13622 [Actinacidiphila glaucinigra]
MRMCWEIKPVAYAGQQVLDVEAALQILYMFADRAREWAPDNTSGLAESVTAMAARMLTDGARTVHQGFSWSATEGSIYVALTP